MAGSKLEYMTATRMRELLVSRKASAVELLDMHIECLRKLNPIFNAVVALDEDGAHRQARAADDARSRGTDLGKLHGIPMTVKDSFEVLGMPATCGIEELRDYKPAQDAAAITRIRRSGAVIFGKTNVPAGAGDHQTCNILFGLTRNPWNLDRTVGGSSGGAAAALAFGMTPLEFGSDIGGSLRVPAHYCGVYGHKPSFGTVSLEGHIPPPPGHLLQPELAVAGALSISNCCSTSSSIP
jgi:amidase